MQDTELYQQVLGLVAPWKVISVKLDLKAKSVDVFVEHAQERLPCPTCAQPCPVYDHTPSRSWRHLDTCQLKTVLHAETPRVRCDEHGVHQVKVPWAEPRARFTAMFERFAIDVLRETSVLGATSILRISWDEAFGIMERAVARGLARREELPVEFVGIDEKAIRKGHVYLTVVTDLQRGAVLWVGNDRKTSSLDAFWVTVSVPVRAGIKAVAMDMWEPYFKSTVAHLPDGATKIVYDRFHITVLRTPSMRVPCGYWITPSSTTIPQASSGATPAANSGPSAHANNNAPRNKGVRVRMPTVLRHGHGSIERDRLPCARWVVKDRTQAPPTYMDAATLLALRTYIHRESSAKTP